MLRRTTAFLLLFPSLAFGAAPAPDVFPAEFTLKDILKPIRVDARLEDWPESRVMVLDRVEQVTEGRGFWREPGDGSAKVFLAYDTEYLYLAAAVMQDHGPVNHRTGATQWNGDGIELMVSSRPEGSNYFSRGDTHLGFTPGDDARHPRVWCYNRDESPQGSRVAARKTGSGYLLEAAVPLDAFEGLDIGPGKTARMNVALAVGGSITGDRIYTLDFSGRRESWRRPAAWPLVRFVGNAVARSLQAVPDAGPDAKRVLEGTKGSTLLKVADVAGKVTDAKGKPLLGARILTWPRSAETLSEPDGSFRLVKAKVYDSTFFEAVADGYFTALSTAGALTLAAQPEGLMPDSATAGFCPDGVALPSGSLSLFDAKGFSGRPFLAECPSDDAGWDELAAFVKGAKGTPVLRLDATRMQPTEAAARVTTCNQERKLGVRYWMLSFYNGKADSLVPSSDTGGKTLALQGGSGSLPSVRPSGTGGKPLALQGGSGSLPYDVINRYREFYNALKKADPTLVVMGPDLPVTKDQGDWARAFLSYDGDIADALALRVTAQAGGPSSVPDDLWDVRNALRRLRYMTGALAGRWVPLVVTGDDAPAAKESAWHDALWGAALAGQAAREKVLFGFTALPRAASGGELLAGWADVLRAVKGGAVEAESYVDGLEVFAAKKGDEVRVAVLNLKGWETQPVVISLGEKSGDLRVGLGLKKRLEEDVPGYGILLFTLDAKGKKKEGRAYSMPLPRD